MKTNRRRFLKNTTALATTATWLDALESAPFEGAAFQPAAGFSLQIFATNWGFPGTLEAFCQKAKNEGYDGIEVWTPQTDTAREALLAAVQNNGLALGLLCGGSDANPAKHLAQFEAALEKALTIKPLYINCHSGRDWFSFEQNRPFIEATTRQHRATGIPIYHETHRGRILFAAHTTRQFLENLPDLRLTLDISHWCNVHESLLHDQADSVALALARTDHLHARIGHPEGPQVNDPRAPEWEQTVLRHLEWWDKVLEIKAKAGQRMTILTEFGPPDYLPALPYTRQPVADQWAINAYMKDLLRKRYLGM
jgi:sugar phosphate isomerase/epimerase